MKKNTSLALTSEKNTLNRGGRKAGAGGKKQKPLNKKEVEGGERERNSNSSHSFIHARSFIFFILYLLIPRTTEFMV